MNPQTMKKILKLSLAFAGIAIASIARSSNLSTQPSDIVAGGSCVQTGDCGTTPGGVKLIGFWRESEQ